MENTENKENAETPKELNQRQKILKAIADKNPRTRVQQLDYAYDAIIDFVVDLIEKALEIKVSEQTLQKIAENRGFIMAKALDINTEIGEIMLKSDGSSLYTLVLKLNDEFPIPVDTCEKIMRFLYTDEGSQYKQTIYWIFKLMAQITND